MHYHDNCLICHREIGHVEELDGHAESGGYYSVLLLLTIVGHALPYPKTSLLRVLVVLVSC